MNKYEALKKYFGYDSFRTGQEKLIDSIMNKQDVLAIMPTGAGKSVCYQVPALLMPGITLVISPLISLMKDQVQGLNEAGVHAAYINSSLTEGQITKALSFASQGRYKIIYAAPERLETYGFQAFAKAADISMLAVDEAHCISQWGQDFRPSYLNISSFLSILPYRPVIAAFTATATERVRSDIRSSLQLNNPTELVTGFDRPNLFFSVKKPKHKLPYLLHYIRQHSGESGIIYCATRKNVDNVYEALKADGIAVTRYHAGLSQEERRQNQEDFTYDRSPVVVATNAFGMGIDKSNVRFVVHFNMPQSVENYYQEAGRAGRDGEPSECVLLYSKQDIMIIKNLLQHGTGERIDDLEYRRMQSMINYCEGNSCLRDYILRYFGEEGIESCDNCSRCLNEEDDDEEAYSSASIRPTRTSGGRKSSHSSGSATIALNEKGQELFEKLRTLRLEIAREESMPPYIIFADKTLTDMALKNPLDREEMLHVSGVGDNKFEKYGERFLEVIRGFTGGSHISTGSLVRNDSEAAMSTIRPIRITKVDFYLTKEEADLFEYTEDLNAAGLAEKIYTLADRNRVKKLFGTTITKEMTARGYGQSEYKASTHLVSLTDAGKAAGLIIHDRTSHTGTVYPEILYTEKAQREILTWYIR